MLAFYAHWRNCWRVSIWALLSLRFPFAAAPLSMLSNGTIAWGISSSPNGNFSSLPAPEILSGREYPSAQELLAASGSRFCEPVHPAALVQA